MLTKDYEQELRNSVNPAYKDQKGTESYERRMLLGEIDRLRKQVAENYKNAVEAGTVACHYRDECEAMRHQKVTKQTAIEAELAEYKHFYKRDHEEIERLKAVNSELLARIQGAER